MSTRRGLQPRTGKRGRAAVLALDLISDFDFPDGTVVRRALATRVGPIQRLLATARRQRVTVIYANDNLGTWRSDAPALIRHCLEQDSAGAEVIRPLLPDERDFIVLKPRHSAFYGSPLDALLDEQKIGTLVITGVSAESCVWMTACDAHTRGYSLVIPADTLAGASAPALRRTLTSVREVLGARVPAAASTLRFKGGRLI
jgi:nicotinamidase-related amidase